MSRLSPDERLARYGPTRATASGSATPTCGCASTEDRQATGDEPIWGYAKTMRPRSTQGPTGRPGPSELDVVVAGALVIDPVLGVVKADIGIKDGRIVGVGPGRQPGHQLRHRAARSGRTPSRSWATA